MLMRQVVWTTGLRYGKQGLAPEVCPLTHTCVPCHVHVPPTHTKNIFFKEKERMNFEFRSYLSKSVCVCCSWETWWQVKMFLIPGVTRTTCFTCQLHGDDVHPGTESLPNSVQSISSVFLCLDEQTWAADSVSTSCSWYPKYPVYV